MAVQTLSEALDNLYTTTWLHMKEEAIDQIFDATPFWFWMRDKGRLKTKVGGRYILEALEYAKNDGVGFIGKGGSVSLNDREFLTEASWTWHYLVAPLVRFGTDDQQNRGKTKIMDLMNSKLTNANNSLVDTLETTLAAAAGTAQGAFDGLQLLVKDDPTTSTTVGGINQLTYTWWRNKTKNMTGISFATLGVYWMRNMLNNVTNNRRKDRPDIILSGQTPFELYEENAYDALQIIQTKLAELGFDSCTFKGIPMVWSPAIANTRMYFLNTNFLYFVYDPGVYFDMTEWKAIPEQVNDRAAQIVTACSFITNRRRTQGVLFNLDTP
jgi:hypothetical protein